MQHKNIVDYFFTLINNHQKIQILRCMILNKGSKLYDLFDFIDTSNEQKIDKYILTKFLKKHNPSIKIVPLLDEFLRYYSTTGQTIISQKQFQFFVNTQALDIKKQRQHYETQYILYLMIIKQFENLREQSKFKEKLRFVDSDALFTIISKNKDKITKSDIYTYIRDISGVRLQQSEIACLIQRINKHYDNQSIAIKQFRRLFLNLNNSKQKQFQISQTKTKSTADKLSSKKQFMLESTQIKNQLKKKLSFHGKQKFKQILTKKALSFLLCISKSQQQLNRMKRKLFKSYKINLTYLFQYMDLLHSQFLTTSQLQDYFSHNSFIFMFLYGNQGIIQFSDFIKMMVPIQFTKSDLNNNFLEEVNEEGVEQIMLIMNKMSNNQDRYLQDLSKISQQLKIKNEQILKEIFLQPKSAQDLTRLFSENKIVISEMQLKLLYRKYDRNYDNLLELSDFSIYFAQ